MLRSHEQQGGKRLTGGTVLFTLLGGEGEQDTHVVVRA